MARDPFLTLDCGATEEGAGGGGAAGTAELAVGADLNFSATSFDEGGGGGMLDANRGGERGLGEGEREDPGEGERRTLERGDIWAGERDIERLGPGVGLGVRGRVLPLGDGEGEVGLRGDMA